MVIDRHPSLGAENAPPLARAIPIRVLLVGNYLLDGQESMQRFAEAMLKGLRARGADVRLARPAAIFGRFCKSSRGGIGKWLGYLDKFILFPRRLRREIRAWQCLPGAAGERVPLVVHICDHSNAFYAGDLQDIPHVVTCHDLLAVRSARGEISENPTRWSGRILQSIILRGLNQAQHVTCVSQATERDLRRLSDLPPSRISVVANALNYAYSPVPRDEAAASARKSCAPLGRPGPGPKFILHVGGNHWYKNRLGVLRIYAQLVESANPAPALVLVGEPLTEEMKAFIRDRNLEERVYPLHDCNNEQLRALYSAAGLLLFPSLAEGFGWPVIEAQACGCPVVCSDVAPFPEVAGSGASMVAPADTAGFVDRLRQVLSDADLRSRLIEQGLANAERYRPETMIDGYQQRYATMAARLSDAKPTPECAPGDVQPA